MSTSLKRIVQIFSLNMNALVEHTNKKRWLNVLNELTQHSPAEIEAELDRLLTEFPFQNQLYYLEAVRRNLMVKRNEERKKESMPKAIKDLFK